MVGDGHDGSIANRDIVFNSRDERLKHISALHYTNSPLLYVLLFLTMTEMDVNDTVKKSYR